MAIQITLRSWVVLIASILVVGYVLILISFLTDDTEADSINLYKNEISDLKTRFQSVKKLSFEQANKLKLVDKKLSQITEEKLTFQKLIENLEKDKNSNMKSASATSSIRYELSKHFIYSSILIRYYGMSIQALVL